MPTAKKGAVIEELTDKLGRVNAAALIEYRGLTVAEIGDLRNRLRQQDVEFHVTKNTLLREAAHRNNITALDELFNGPTAVAFIYGDESTGTKALNEYFRTARVGAIKSGILKGGRAVSAEQFTKLADLPNRAQLQAQVAGLLESPLSKLASLFNAATQQFAYAIASLEDKVKDAGESATVGTATGVAATTGTAAVTPQAPPQVTEDATAPAVASVAETPAEAVAADVTAAPEEEGGAVPGAVTSDGVESQAEGGSVVAEDATAAPESEGSAGA